VGKFIHSLFPWVVRPRLADRLAREAEGYARRLNGCPVGQGTLEGLLDLLESTCLVLRRLVERGTGAQMEGEDACHRVPPEERQSASASVLDLGTESKG
jgi:hypothetical protein